MDANKKRKESPTRPGKTSYESRREREFYRYYEPIRSLSKDGPRYCDLNSAAAIKAHEPFSPPDRALTAFCQLGALRLRAGRAMMFFFDSNYGYILAEATKSLSLQNDSVHDDGDGLWMGHAIIPRGCAVCEHTVNLPSTASTEQFPDSSSVHIINDLRKDTRFCSRPFVVDGPKACFYAGVPITTPKGINIGAYCVLDDKPRNGLDSSSITFLKDMSTTIMDHLTMVRAKAEHELGTQMIAGLSAFVEGAPSLSVADENSEGRAPRYNPARRSREKITKISHSTPAVDKALSKPPTPTIRPTPTPVAHDESQHLPQVTSNEAPTSGRASPNGAQKSSKGKREEDLRAQIIAENVRTTFQRAAQVVREAIDLDGTMFIDASVGSYGGLLEGEDDPSSSDQGLDSATSGEETNGPQDFFRRKSMFDVERKPCLILGSSCTAQGCEIPNNDAECCRSVSFNEQFLRRLLKKYPRGQIWNFNEEGDVSSDSESSGDSISPQYRDVPRYFGTEISNGDTPPRKMRPKRTRKDYSDEIRRLFPGVRSFAIVGVWNQVKGRWVAACAVWTFSPIRLFSNECEVNFIAAFCDVIMAEVHRLESQNSANAKMDFISSISHELRSPLHGILGSTECLQDQESDNYSRTLIDQIDTCGRTLLDIVDHLLDFSKINHYARKQSEPVDEHHRRKGEMARVVKPEPLGGTKNLHSDVSLDTITEEVVQATVYSYCFSKERLVILDRKVTITFDTDCSFATDWRCHIATGGWKRLCINLVSNALKYTNEGFVKVSLGSFPAKGPKRAFNAVLTVTDSGCGMSREFLENHLFKAFSQEDGLAEGTGLGMNLVAKIVKAFGGKIEVKSTKGHGTVVTVVLPLDRPHSKLTEDEQKVHRDGLKHLSVGIVEPAKVNSSAKKLDQGSSLLRENIRRICVDLTSESFVSDLASTDANIITETDLLQLQSAPLGPPNEPDLNLLSNRPLVVVCNTAMSERRLRTSTFGLLQRPNVEFTTQPVGPSRLANSIRACMTAFKSQETSRSQVAVIQEAKINGSASLTEGFALALDLKAKEETPDYFAQPHVPIEKVDGEQPSSINMNGAPVPSLAVQQPSQNGSPYPEESERMIEKPLFVQTKSSERLEDSIIHRPPLETLGSAESLSSKCSLLLVDDNDINLRLLITYAEKRGHPKQTARDGLQAVEVYKAAWFASLTSKLHDHPKVILMDINMPVLNGFEATRHIRHFEQQEGLEPAIIIALTGLGDAHAQQEAYTSGMNMFLTKPVRLKELTKVLDALKTN